MVPFLKQVAQHIFDEHKDNMASLCIVLPSKRGAVFLKKYLHEVFQTTIWLPQILSIDEFVAEVSELNIIDQLNSLIEMHTFYQKNIEEAMLQSTEIVIQQDDNKDLSFDQYLRKANIILQDFNEIDRHLVEPKDIFSNLKDIKYIENWSLNNDELSPFQKNYVALFDAMGKIYNEFTQHLLAKNEAYQGLAYRVAVKNFKTEKWAANHKHFLFCGFNAFNKAESLIISGLVNQKKATVLWDSDTYFIKNDIQEAGFFLREAKRSKQFGKDFSFENNDLATDKKNIEIVGAPNNMAQTQVIQTTLENWAKGVYKPDQTAIVMADEALLMPVLYAIPEHIEKLNVTLGYEIKHSVVYDLLIKWLNLQEYASVNSNKLYYKDINKILSHVVIQKYFKRI
jgi:ATP-dependent helicase/nuclease subunit B